MAGKVYGRVKATMGNKGHELPYVTRDGQKRVAKRVTVATVWTDDQGRLSLSFEGPQAAAILKTFGLGEGDKLFYDLFVEDGAPAASGKQVEFEDF